MHILVISQYWEPENGVPQRRWSWFSEILKSAGHEVVALVPPPHYETKITVKSWLSQNFKRRKYSDCFPSEEGVVRTGFFPGGNGIARKALNQVIVALSQIATVARVRRSSSFKPNLIVGTVPALPTAFVTRVASLVLGVPYIIDLRDAWPELLEESRRWNESVGHISLHQRILNKGPLQFAKWVVKGVLKRSLAQATAVTVTSEDHRERLEKELMSWSRDKAHTVVSIRNVFPVNSSQNRHLLKESQGEKHTFNVLYAGTLGRAQDLENALVAGKLAEDRGVPISFRFVGAGAAKAQLRKTAKQLGLDAEFQSRGPSDSLGEHYEWADTALVHLSDWPALALSVPSKTYELMDLGIHITGVVSGEAARIITENGAGHVVAPGDPESLANLWSLLASSRTMLTPDSDAREWVLQERNQNSPKKLLQTLEIAGGA